MENNHIRNHICGNQYRSERNRCGRIEREMLYSDGCDMKCQNERDVEVCYIDVQKNAYKNKQFRNIIWTGNHLQMTLMSIPCSQGIGVEVHDDSDQYIRVEDGYAMVLTGKSETCLHNKQRLCKGDAVLIPAGVWHDVVNIGRSALKLSSVYAPPNHLKCDINDHKKDIY